MPLLDLSAVPHVALNFMNDDHATATEIANQLHAEIALAKNTETDNTSKITELLAELYQHNVEHFAREELQMVDAAFPPYDCHKGEHERVLTQMQAVLNTWQKEYDLSQLEHYLRDVMVPWFIQHINTMDTVTAMFISRQQS
ncbi:bacteriohemerythrin [Neptunomonas japonica]|uniref:bacteriohemerythrin n=1 Tax=Neptunomonas japonica TaxID=417574 RepID=UPI00040AA8A9|nr:hemerythrin family protein [Neptunomonas japonica]